MGGNKKTKHKTTNKPLTRQQLKNNVKPKRPPDNSASSIGSENINASGNIMDSDNIRGNNSNSSENSGGSNSGNSNSGNSSDNSSSNNINSPENVTSGPAKNSAANTVTEQMKTLSIADNSPIKSPTALPNASSTINLPNNTPALINENSLTQLAEITSCKFDDHPFEAIVNSIVKSQQAAISDLTNQTIEQRNTITNLQSNVINDQKKYIQHLKEQIDKQLVKLHQQQEKHQKQQQQQQHLIQNLSDEINNIKQEQQQHQHKATQQQIQIEQQQKLMEEQKTLELKQQHEKHQKQQEQAQQQQAELKQQHQTLKEQSQQLQNQLQQYQQNQQNDQQPNQKPLNVQQQELQHRHQQQHQLLAQEQAKQKQQQLTNQQQQLQQNQYKHQQYVQQCQQIINQSAQGKKSNNTQQNQPKQHINELPTQNQVSSQNEHEPAQNKNQEPAQPMQPIQHNHPVAAQHSNQTELVCYTNYANYSAALATPKAIGQNNHHHPQQHNPQQHLNQQPQQHTQQQTLQHQYAHQQQPTQHHIHHQIQPAYKKQGLLKTRIISDSTCKLIKNRDLKKHLDPTKEEAVITNHPNAEAAEINHYNHYHLQHDLPDNLIIVAGLNDVLHHPSIRQPSNYQPPIDPIQIAEHVVNIGRNAKAAGVPKISIATLIVPKFMTGRQAVEKVNNFIRDICRREGFNIVDNANITADDLGDAIHVNNSTGNAILRTNICSNFYTYSPAEPHLFRRDRG